MIPIDFPQKNCVYAKNQPEYLELSAHKDKDGIVTSCWRVTFWERIRILFTGRLYFQTMTFNQPLQPQKPSIENPLEE
jgi:hypothetical protein